jgi:hypothetical protein
MPMIVTCFTRSELSAEYYPSQPPTVKQPPLKLLEEVKRPVHHRLTRPGFALPNGNHSIRDIPVRWCFLTLLLLGWSGDASIPPM